MSAVSVDKAAHNLAFYKLQDAQQALIAGDDNRARGLIRDALRDLAHEDE